MTMYYLYMLVFITIATTSIGPAKRFYEITHDGEMFLNDWVMFMERNYNNLGRFLKKYRQTLVKKETI